MNRVQVGERIEFIEGHYPRIRVWDPTVGRDRYVYLYRLVAYAHGIIDSLWDPRHVHHRDGDGWNSRPENLEAVTPEQHAEYEPHVLNLNHG